MVRVADLFALQEVDSLIDALQRQLDELNARSADNDELSALEERSVSLEEVHHTIESEQRQASYDVDDGKARVTAVEEKLYGGSVTSSRELRELQRELELLQRRQSEREELLLSIMTRRDETNAQLTATRSALAEGRSVWETEQREAATRAEEFEKELAELRTRRSSAARPIDAQSMVIYERVRRTRGGRAVARVERGACLGCRISLPSNLFQKARSGATIVQCSSCDRILFVG